MPVGSDMHPIPPLKPTTLEAVRDPAAKAIFEEIVDLWGRLTRFTQIAREAVTTSAGDHDHDASTVGHGGILTNDRHDGYMRLDVVAGSPPGATADTVFVQARDFAAGDARAYVQSESGTGIWLGNLALIAAENSAGFYLDAGIGGELNLGTVRATTVNLGQSNAATAVSGASVQITAAAAVTVSAASLTITTTTGTTTITDTTDAASVQVLRLDGDRATMADGDEAYVSMMLSDDAGTQKEIGRLTWVATDVNAATSVDGRIDLDVMAAGSLVNRLQLDGDALSLISGASAIELRWYEPSGDGTSYVSFKSPALAGNTVYTLPTALPAVTGYVLSCTDAGVMSWAAGSSAHAILDGSTHSDSVAATVSRGSLIYGNSTPKWDELVIGASGKYVRSDGTDASWAALDWPKGYMYGLAMTYASATTATVAAGQARDDADAANITLSAAVTVNITTLGAAVGLDRATASATATTHGTATFEPSASLYSETALSSTVRSLTGTASSVGTALTGTSTLFLSEVAVGDVIRSATKGASRVTAIASNTALTLAAAFPGGDCTAEAQTLYENLIVWPDTATAGDQRRVNTISHAGTSVVVSSALTSNGAGKTIAIGSELASAWYFVWLVSGGSGTTCILSTQRTTPYGVSGYTTSKRRVGAMRNNASGNFLPARSESHGPRRITHVDCSEDSRVLSSGAATSFTAVPADAGCPPTAGWAMFCGPYIALLGTNTWARVRATGTTGVAGNGHIIASSYDTDAPAGFILPIIGQQLEYKIDSAGTGLFLDVLAWVEEL